MPTKEPPFHALTAAEWLQVCQDLIFSEVKVCYYLLARCPYGDRTLEINLDKDAQALSMGRSTLSTALQSLEEKGYVEIDQRRPCYKVRPLKISAIAERTRQQQSAERDTVQSIEAPATSVAETPIPPTEASFGPANEGIEDRTRVKTNKTKTLSYSGEREKKSQVVIHSRVRPAKRAQQPDGPWLLPDGKFDPAFIEAVARNWVTRWGGELSDRKTDVLSHFGKDPANIAIQWRWYAEAYRERFEKAHTQLAAGGTLDEEYQQRLVASTRALTAELPAELDPVSPSIAAVRIAPAIAAPPEAAVASSSEAQASARLQLYNNWLHHSNPKVRASAIAEAKSNPSYQLETDPDGEPLRIVEVTP